MKNKKGIHFPGIMAVQALMTAVMLLFPQKEQAQNRPFVPLTLAAATDLHYLAPELTDGGPCFTRVINNADGKAMAYCEEITDVFVSQIIAKKPDALILSGDLTFNGARASHEALAAKLAAIEDAGIPVLVIPGNHDLDNTMAASFHGDAYTTVESIDAGRFAGIYGDFGYREALARDQSSLSYVYELSPYLRILMLDVNTKNARGTLTDDTFHWAESQLEAAREAGAGVVAVSHQNLLTHNIFFSDGYVMGNAEKLLELYGEYGVLCNLSGHVHFQHIAQSPQGTPEFVTSSLITSPCQYGILEIKSSEVNYHTEQVRFSHQAEAGRFFRNTARRMAMEAVPDAREDLYSLFADFSAAWFAGRLDLLPWDDALYKELCEQYPYIGSYVGAIIDEGFKDHTSFSHRFPGGAAE